MSIYRPTAAGHRKMREKETNYFENHINFIIGIWERILVSL